MTWPEAFYFTFVTIALLVFLYLILTARGRYQRDVLKAAIAKGKDNGDLEITFGDPTPPSEKVSA